jgi:hypothetical protein
LRDHSKGYPRFVTTSPAPNCAEDVRPNWEETYWRELQEFRVSGVLAAWEERKGELLAERDGLHAAALPAADPAAEAGDLLELLEDQQVEVRRRCVHRQ